MLADRQDVKLFWLIISACFRHDWLTAMQVALADVIDVIDGRKLFNQLLLTNLRNCNYFTHLPPKSLIFHHPCNQNSFHNNNSAYLPLTLNQEDKFQTYFGTGDSFWDPLRNFLYKFTRIEKCQINKKSIPSLYQCFVGFFPAPFFLHFFTSLVLLLWDIASRSLEIMNGIIIVFSLS